MDQVSIEPVIEPELPIIDPHHHLWFIPPATLRALADGNDPTGGFLTTMYGDRPRYLFDELLADTASGHNCRATVFIEARAMYRAEGPAELHSLGEVEYVNGVAAMAASGVFGETRLCAGIVGCPDLFLGEKVRDVLAEHVRAAGGRYRGARSILGFDERHSELWRGLGARPHVLMDPAFRAGFAQLHDFELSFEAAIAATQIPELVDLANAFPATQIVLNHLGGPIALASGGTPSSEEFVAWRGLIEKAAACPNIAVKLGGLGNPISGLPYEKAMVPAASEALAREWRPYMETCIEVFGAGRCMFESNFPVDGFVTSYRNLWNAFKRIASQASADEKHALFFGTANRVYRLGL